MNSRLILPLIPLCAFGVLASPVLAASNGWRPPALYNSQPDKVMTIPFRIATPKGAAWDKLKQQRWFEEAMTMEFAIVRINFRKGNQFFGKFDDSLLNLNRLIHISGKKGLEDELQNATLRAGNNEGGNNGSLCLEGKGLPIKHSEEYDWYLPMGTMEVSALQYAAVMGGKPPTVKDFCMRPKRGISRKEAEEFARKLPSCLENPPEPKDGSYTFTVHTTQGDTETTGHKISRLYFDLPTIAEWEFAARGADGVNETARDNNTPMEGAANAFLYEYENCSELNGEAPVAGKECKSNCLGLFHMLGNVREWVKDSEAPHGGYFNTPETEVSPAQRGPQCKEGVKDKYTGFRLVMRSQLSTEKPVAQSGTSDSTTKTSSGNGSGPKIVSPPTETPSKLVSIGLNYKLSFYEEPDLPAPDNPDEPISDPEPPDGDPPEPKNPEQSGSGGFLGGNGGRTGTKGGDGEDINTQQEPSPLNDVTRANLDSITPEVLRLLEKSAADGSSLHRYYAGVCHLYGYGTRENKEKAVYYFSMEGHKHPASQCYLGLCYDNGWAVSHDLKKALELYRQSAERGNAEARYNLGIFYEKGIVVEKDAEKAVELYQQAAKQNLPDARHNLGVCYLYGNGIKKNQREAVSLFRLAAAQGHAEAQYNLGLCYALGEGIPVNMEYARELLAMAEKQKHRDVLYGLGTLHEEGKIFPKNLQKAAQLYEEAMAKGSDNARVKLASYHATGKLGKADLKKAFSLYKTAADNGHTEACYMVGTCYATGKGVPQNMSEARRYYELAASKGHAGAEAALGECYEKDGNLNKAISIYQRGVEQNNADAQFRLGRCYARGTGVPKNLSKALELYEKAAAQGQSSAQYNLGYHYEMGDGVPKNMRKAMSFYESSANQSNTYALITLGTLYETGVDGVPANPKKALEYYRQAADQGDHEAEYAVGRCYMKGVTGVPRDVKTALEYYERAAAGDYVPALEDLAGFHLEGIKGHLSPNKHFATELFKKAKALKAKQ